MELYDFVKLIRNKKKTIFSIVFTVLVLVLLVNFVLPKKYGSEMQVLIIQKNLNNTDPYLVSKSSEHLGNVLGQVIYSGSFYKKVINSGFGVSETYFGKTSKDQLKKWSSTINVRNVEDTGILYISATHSDREQAELIVESIGYNLKTFHMEYHGSGENVEVKVINEPVTSNFPVKPNMIINVIAGLVFSLLFSFIYIYLFPDRKYDLRLLPERGKKKTKQLKTYLVEENNNVEKNTNKETKEKSSEKNYHNENEIYQGESSGNDDDQLGGYEHEENDEEGDDLEIDYDDIRKKGNINNIL
ncbi:MAG: Wzz/FepE/Etk N-terminal domain-containing protein [Patescibacteria group bacterium]|jgi:capsular polysaccharide biosynthesis protein|nr:Wzz/FepE/Etk N-terminal domain-containing protein [Patescibacteria group bacterium]